MIPRSLGEISAVPGGAESSPPDTIDALLHTGRALSGGGPALSGGHQALTHNDLHRLLVQSEASLRRLGVGRHTRVMTALPDGPLACCALLALTRSAVCAPVNPDLRAAEFQALIPELRVQALVAHSACADIARRAAAALGLPVIEVDWDDGGALRWTGSRLAGPFNGDPAQPDDPALVLLTSGSSARPKRVPLTHRQLTLSAQRLARSIALTPGDVCLNFMPMFHVGAVVDLLLAPLSAGGSLVRPESMSGPAFFDSLDHDQPTWFQGVPTLLHELAVHGLRSRRAPSRPSLRLVRSVSSPLPSDWIHDIEAALGAPVIEIYGMTETAGVITSNPLPPAPRKTGSVGLATSLEMTIRESPGQVAATGVPGEIHVRGHGVMGGYENREGSGSGLTEDGWLRTGDEGYLDQDGYLFITGRIGDQINRGGEKISPREIDDVLVSHPAVQDAAAFALPHPQLGQEVAAAVVLRPGMQLTATELTELTSRQLAYFKVPQSIHVLSALPRGPGGKLRRRLLPELVRDVAALGSVAPDPTDAPMSEMEKRVASWWAAGLQVSGVTRDSDFFEIGGDSLAAAGFAVGMEKELGIQVRPAVLFDHPTVAAYAGYLENAMAELQGRHQVDGPQPMNDGYRRCVLAAVGVWPGVRQTADSLFIGQRMDAPGTPIFWCGQGRSEFEQWVSHLPSHHPVYGTRSLYLFEGKQRKDEEALAMLLAEEIEHLRTGREVIIGGFCAGGRIMHEAACQLRALGAPIRMVFMHDAWTTRRIDVPVAMGFTNNDVSSPYRSFSRPEASMAKRFTAGWKIWTVHANHDTVYTDETLASEVAKLRALWENPSIFDRSPPMHEVLGVAYRASIASRLHPPVLMAGRTGYALVTIRNLSRHTWLPAKLSGLHLGHRWLNEAGQAWGAPGPSIPLPREVPPGKSLTLHIKVKAPHQAGQGLLEIDMVDEGLAWFSEKKSARPSKSLVLRIAILDRFSLGIFGKRPETLPS